MIFFCQKAEAIYWRETFQQAVWEQLDLHKQNLQRKLDPNLKNKFKMDPKFTCKRQNDETLRKPRKVP